MTDKELFDSLAYEHKNAYLEMSEAEKAEMYSFCDAYRVFLDNGKTERECVKLSVKAAQEAGFVDLDGIDELKPGDKIYKVNRGKSIFMAVIGKEDV
ncbi:MAG: aminopeptidase, partial [Candidatus Ornithomonoglobus sp.]